MVSEFLLDGVFSIVSGFFKIAPEISWSVDTSAFEFVRSSLRCAGYLLPMNTVITIVGLIVALTGWKVLVAFLRTVWDVLPLA